jgi:spore maturation protein CgeB
MNIKLFYHSIVSDWNHGNAHFLRGVCTELLALGHELTVYEPQNGWSYTNMIKDEGEQALWEYFKAFPLIKVEMYHPGSIDIVNTLSDADMVIVHEWNNYQLVKEIGNYRKKSKQFKLFFHDTHHRAISDPEGISAYDLSGYDGVLAFGEVIKNIYLRKKWARAAWTWHEAADTNVFYPHPNSKRSGDLVWIGNWGDNERTEELHEFLIKPVKQLGLKAKVYGVRYPEKALEALDKAGIEYGGWIANYKVPKIFSEYSLTVHVPRKPYVKILPGIPTIRPFEAMASGIPLISAPWNDKEKLFDKGRDFISVKSGNTMLKAMEELLYNKHKAAFQAESALNTIKSKHTCRHRAEQLLEIYYQLVEKKIHQVFAKIN